MENKYQEALADIRCDTYNFIDNNYDDTFKMVYNKQFKLLQELVDKATPKKIIKINAKDNPNVRKGSLTDMVGFTYQCPTCKENMSFLSVYNYCQYCGQKFNRSDE